jgi:hypothetical protein
MLRRKALGNSALLWIHTIARKSSPAAVHEKRITVAAAFPKKIQKHVLVVSPEENAVGLVPIAKPDQKINQTLRVRAAIYIVPEKDEPISPSRPDFVKQPSELVERSMQITDRE